MFLSLFFCIVIATASSCLFSFLSNVTRTVPRGYILSLGKRRPGVESFLRRLNSDVSLVSAIEGWRVISILALGAFIGVYCLGLHGSVNCVLPVVSVAIVLVFDAVFVRITPVGEEAFVRCLPLIAFLYGLIYPLNFIFCLAARPFPDRRERKVTEDDLIKMVDKASEDGVLEKKEKEMIRNVVHLSETEASEIMIPRLDVVAVDKDTSIRGLVDVAMDRGFSRIPVYDGTIDNIIGVVHTKDLMASICSGEMDKPLVSFARPPVFIPGSKKNYDIMTEMQQTRTAMAIVVDEYGGTEGIITIEDVVEEIVGDITDEYDKEVELMKRQQDGSALVAGKASIQEVNEFLSVSISDDEVDSIGGYVYAKTGHIPKEGEVIESDGMRITVEKVLRRRITLLRIELLKAAPEPAAS